MTIIKTFEIEDKKKSSSESHHKLPRSYIFVVVASLFVLVLIEIWASNTVITYGEKYDKLSALQKNLKMENQILENEIAAKSSLGSIASKSAELGFAPSKSIQYIR